LRALVTGANGFIGSHLVEALVARGDEVRALLRPTSDRRWLEGLDYAAVIGDLDDTSALEAAAAGVDVVYHVAGVTKARDDRDFMRVNARGTANVAAACSAQETPPRLVYVSSQAAAGPCGSGAGASREDEECLPITDYGQSKLDGERALAEYAAKLPYVILRPSAIYGPRDAEMFLFFKFLSHGVEPAFGRAARYVSLCYISDIVAALLLASEVDRARGQTYFVAHDEVWDWHRLSQAAAAALGVKARRVRMPEAVLFGAATIAELTAAVRGRAATLNRQKARDLVQRRWVCDISKAKDELGFAPAVGFEAGARRTASWYREQGWL